LQQAGRPGLSIFSITPIGLAITAAGTLFMLLLGRWLLPDRGKTLDLSSELNITDYFTELVIKSDSPLLDKTLPEVEADDRLHIKTVGWLRNGRRVSTSSTQHTLQAGDVLLVRTSPNDIATIRQEPGVELRPVEQYLADAVPSNGSEDESTEAIMQTVVAPGSDLVGRSIAEIDFRRRYGVVVLSLWRQRGWLHEELSHISLRAGDVLVLQGEPQALARVASERDFLMMFAFEGEPRLRRRAPLAGAIMIATILATALNVLPLEIAALAGACAMVLLGCTTIRQAYRSIDVRIYVFIAGAIPLGAAMQQSGVADVLANWLEGAIGGLSETLILLALFGVVAVITQFMSDSATTAVLAPVALALAQALGHSPEAYVVTVAMASVAAFFTPIGHHGNLLVYGPGRYRFADFVRVGTPLTVLVAVVVVLTAQLVWPVQGPGSG
jgi:di/tricarboxylate transporter